MMRWVELAQGLLAGALELVRARRGGKPSAPSVAESRRHVEADEAAQRAALERALDEVRRRNGA